MNTLMGDRLMGKAVNVGDRIRINDNPNTFVVTRVGEVNEYGTRRIYHRIDRDEPNPLITYTMDYQCWRVP